MSPYLGVRLQQPQEQRYPFLTVNAVFPRVKTKIWLPVLGIFNVRTDAYACDRTLGCPDTVRESALKVDSRRKIPCLTGESNLRSAACRSDALSTELPPRKHNRCGIPRYEELSSQCLAFVHPSLCVTHPSPHNVIAVFLKSRSKTDICEFLSRSKSGVSDFYSLCQSTPRQTYSPHARVDFAQADFIPPPPQVMSLTLLKGALKNEVKSPAKRAAFG